MNKFKDTIKHNDDLIAYYRERLAIAEIKREFFQRLSTVAVDVDSANALAVAFLKAEKRGLNAVRDFAEDPARLRSAFEIESASI